MIRAFITAVRTLTVIPLPGKDAKDFSSTLYFFPLIGGVLGFLVGGAVFLHDKYTGWHEIAAFVGLAVSVWLTGCLHIDGLADVCDSFGASTRERRLEVMKDSRTGVYGVVGVVLVLLVKFLCLMRLNGLALLTMIPVAMALSRMAQVAVMVKMPYARSNGKAGVFVENASIRHFAVALLVSAIFAFYTVGSFGLAMTGMACIVALCVRFWARRQLGGVTGDVIGFTNELVEIVCLVAIGVKACGV